VRTPAHKIPSHGTDLFGQRYAFDFVRPDHRKGLHLQPAGSLRSFLLGGRTRDDYYGDLRQDRAATSPCSRPTRCNSA
jgi:hypothetical protein